jgi:hypothetical protein
MRFSLLLVAAFPLPVGARFLFAATPGAAGGGRGSGGGGGGETRWTAEEAEVLEVAPDVLRGERGRRRGARRGQGRGVGADGGAARAQEVERAERVHDHRLREVN